MSKKQTTINSIIQMREQIAVLKEESAKAKEELLQKNVDILKQLPNTIDFGLSFDKDAFPTHGIITVEEINTENVHRIRANSNTIIDIMKCMLE